MNVRIISTFTTEDEDRFARLLLTTVRHVLDDLNVAYAIRVETSSGELLEHSRSVEEAASGREIELPPSEGEPKDDPDPPVDPGASESNKNCSEGQGQPTPGGVLVA